LPRVRDADFVASVPSIPKLANERTAEFTALRASGLRGLRWDDVDLKRGELHAPTRNAGRSDGRSRRPAT
jgi:integrase